MSVVLLCRPWEWPVGAGKMEFIEMAKQDELPGVPAPEMSEFKTYKLGARDGMLVGMGRRSSVAAPELMTWSSTEFLAYQAGFRSAK